MTEYDVELQRRAAIKTLTAKQLSLRELFLSGKAHPHTEYYNGATNRKELETVFNVYCDNARQSVYGSAIFASYFAKKRKADIALVVEFIKIEKLIKRLQGGEDPRIILLEIVSDE